MKLLLGATTDCGRRANNEDFYSAVSGEELGIGVDAVLVVADGMGGRNFGERASEAAVESVKSTLISRLGSGVPGHAEIKTAIEVALQLANDNVFELSQADDESEGMGTTCVLAVIAHGRLHLGHAGDSRAYVIHHGRIEQLTDDHSFVAEQVRAGIITEESARKSKFRNVITRAVGIEPTIEPDVAEYPIEEVDAVLLCTDGLTNMVTDKDMERVLLTAPSAQAATDKLVRMAKVAGGSDNITAVVARFGEGPIAAVDEEEAEPEVVVTRDDVDPPPTSGSGPATGILSVLLLLFLASTIYLGAKLDEAGYTFQAAPPFVVKPLLPATPLEANLAKLSYAAPVKFYPYPVRPEPLVFNRDDRSILALSSPDGKVVRLGVDGKTLFEFSVPGHKSPTPEEAALETSQSMTPATRHFATDPQGNVYVSDAGARAIYKMKPSGQMIGKITSGLQKPEAIAVDENGNVYVVDVNTLKYIEGHAAGQTVPSPAQPAQ